MDERTSSGRAVDLLQELGLKEYEAKAFVALTRLPRATAKDISDVSEVPRTRVYDAVRVLESKGLVEIQHSNPQQFRAVSIAEAIETIKHEYESRTKTLQNALQDLDTAGPTDELAEAHEVWALSGSTAISNRTAQLLGEADGEIVFVVGDEATFADDFVEPLEQAIDRGVTVILGTTDESVRDRIKRELPEARVFVSGLEWISTPLDDGDATQIGRLLLVDRSTILLSSVDGHADTTTETAVFGRGFDNGIVAFVRRVMAAGLLPHEDPGGQMA